MKAIEKAGYKPGEDIYLALDCASTEYFKGGKYEMKGEGKTLTRENVDYLAALARTIRSSRSRTAVRRGRLGRLEAADRPLGDKMQLVGDDLFVTNPRVWPRASRRAAPIRCWSRSTRSAR
jgi:enolase